MKERKYKFLALVVAVTAVGGLALSTWARTRDRHSASSFLFNSVKAPVRTLLRPAQTTSHAVMLSTAQVSMLDGNRVVVLMDAKGDLPGSLTLTLERDSTGTTVIGGSWALIVSYVELTPLGYPDADGGEAESERLVEIGTLSGTITDGALTLDQNGRVVSVDSVQLAINQGSVTYDGINEGTGSAQETNLQDVTSSTGTLILNF